MIDRMPELRRFAEEIKNSKTLVVFYRDCVFPKETSISLTNPEDPRIMSIEDLVVLLEIPFESITEVFEYKGDEYRAEKRQPWWKSLLIITRLAQPEKETRETSPHFTGRFTGQGKQRLADLLGKTVEYHYQPTSAPFFDLTRGEVYSPRQISE